MGIRYEYPLYTMYDVNFKSVTTRRFKDNTIYCIADTNTRTRKKGSELKLKLRSFVIITMEVKISNSSI